MEHTTDTDDWTLTKVLIRLRWPKGWVCECGCDKYRQIRTRPRVLQCASCRRQRSVTAGTLMHRTRLPLRVWFLAIELFVRTVGISARKLAALVGVHVETAWQMLHRIRVAFDGAEPILAGLIKRCVVAIGCRTPRVDPVVECVALIGAESRVRIVQGSPCVDPALGGSTRAKPNVPFAWKHQKRGGDPALVGTMRVEVDLATVLAEGAEIVTAKIGEPERRVGHVLERRLRKTYREVSQRWLARYLAAFASLWPLWAERGGEYRAHEDLPGLVEAVFRRCLAHPRATFAQLTPGSA